MFFSLPLFTCYYRILSIKEYLAVRKHIIFFIIISFLFFVLLIFTPFFCIKSREKSNFVGLKHCKTMDLPMKCLKLRSCWTAGARLSQLRHNTPCVHKSSTKLFSTLVEQQEEQEGHRKIRYARYFNIQPHHRFPITCALYICISCKWLQPHLLKLVIYLIIRALLFLFVKERMLNYYSVDSSCSELHSVAPSKTTSSV